MKREPVVPAGASSSAPYSPGIKAGDFFFSSGQVGIDREKGEVPSDIKGQTRQCFKNLEEVLDAAGLGFDDVAKVNVYLTDMSEFSDMNEAYKEVFPETPPARTTVGVDALASDDFRIEIELVALN